MADRFNLLKKDIEFRIGFHCAPVILGIKTANTITIGTEELDNMDKILNGTSIEYFVIWEEDSKCLIMLFRRNLLENKFLEQSTNELMNRFGYNSLNLDEKLYLLKERFYKYKKQNAQFPHEMGLFLDYPSCDVLGFMEKRGHGCLLCGYWKVYDNKESAISKFKQYDSARLYLINTLNKGCKINELKMCRAV